MVVLRPRSQLPLAIFGDFSESPLFIEDPVKKYWPGTGVQQSTGNVFDWKSTPSSLPKEHIVKMPRPMKTSDDTRNRAFTIYTRARPTKGT